MQTRRSCSQWLTPNLPACLLLTPDKLFKAFGYEAQEKYDELRETEHDNVNDYYFFPHLTAIFDHQKVRISVYALSFKMLIYFLSGIRKWYHHTLQEYENITLIKFLVISLHSIWRFYKIVIFYLFLIILYINCILPFCKIPIRKNNKQFETSVQKTVANYLFFFNINNIIFEKKSRDMTILFTISQNGGRKLYNCVLRKNKQ